ncbi:uncharacterized protein LOC142318820 isoform X2 [Lycorma delicatula]|uniref:uncharacterized protein LOC142318820 isoform X2 n=1 Tax=Lycorma delicatula TaxID=130591 RepID=UPI003F519A9B
MSEFELENIWMTVDLLIDNEKRRRDMKIRVEEWLDGIGARIRASTAMIGTPTSVGIPEFPNCSNSFLRCQPVMKDYFLDCMFSHERGRSQVERLMGSNVVKVTDREYMQNLRTRLQENHEEIFKKRINDREADEVEREKKLIIEGKMGMEEATAALADHPILKITQLTNKMIENNKKLQFGKSRLPRALRDLDFETAREAARDREVPDHEESELAIELDAEEAERQRRLQEIAKDISNEQLFTQEDFDRIKYETPLVKQLRTVESVEELYRLAEQIVGPIPSIE